MKKLCLFLLAFCWLHTIYGQNEICYTYDAAGNRIKRELCCTNCLSGSQAEDRQQAPAVAASGPDKLKLIPNPTTGMFKLETEGIPADAQVVILDMAGKMCARRQLGDGQFDLSAYPPGTYLVSLQYGDFRKSFILEKSSR